MSKTPEQILNDAIAKRNLHAEQTVFHNTQASFHQGEASKHETEAAKWEDFVERYKALVGDDAAENIATQSKNLNLTDALPAMETAKRKPRPKESNAICVAQVKAHGPVKFVSDFLPLFEKAGFEMDKDKLRQQLWYVKELAYDEGKGGWHLVKGEQKTEVLQLVS